MMKFKGTIIEESLTDYRILNEINIIGFKITNDENPKNRWHMFTVLADEETVLKLTGYLKPEKWYAHFWNGNDVIAVFPGKTFRFIHSDHSTWKEAINYGLSLGIPSEQLDFRISD